MSDGDLYTAALHNDHLEASGAVDGADFYPYRGYRYIIYKEGSTYYGLDCNTGKADAYSNANSATLIQAVKDACSAGDALLLRRGLYDNGATQINATGVDLFGESYQQTKIAYNGTDAAITYDGTSAQQTYYKVSNFTIRLDNAAGIGLELVDRCHYFEVSNIRVYGNAAAATGFLIDAVDNGCYWNNFWGCRTSALDVGFKLTSTGTGRANANNFFGCIARSYTAAGTGFHVEDGRTNKFIGCHVEGTNDATPAYYVDDDYNCFTNCSWELTAASVGVELTVNSTNNVWLGGRMNGAGGGGRWNDAGAANVVRYVTDVLWENGGSATILNGNTSIVVAHGLIGTPTMFSVVGSTSDTEEVWVDTVGATNFTINVPAGEHGYK
jgi:hypothetical protein